MKKVLSVIILMAILLTSSVSVFASEGARFIQHDGIYILTDDGRFFRVNTNKELLTANLELIDTDVIDIEGNEYIKDDSYVNIQYSMYFNTEKVDGTTDFVRLMESDIIQDADGNLYFYGGFNEKQIGNEMIIANSQHFFLTENHVLYHISGYGDFDKVSDNVLDYREDSDGNCAYRTLNYDLYRCYIDNLGWIDENDKILENVSDVYSVDVEYDHFSYAKTNDGKWYHWGANDGFQLESSKVIDGNEISPDKIKEPRLANEFIYQRIYTRNGAVSDTFIWALDGHLYHNGSKIVDNIAHCHDGYKFLTADGDLIIITRAYINDYQLKVIECDTNYDLNVYKYQGFKELQESGIDKDGNFVYVLYDEYKKELYFPVKFNVNYKYLNRSDWADSEIALADEIGYIDSVKLFDMQSNIKREDFCNMIVDFCEKHLGRELSTTTNPFKDTENEKVIKAYANGIITGVSSDSFAPNDNITREQMCAIMTRATKFLKSDVQFGEGIKFSDMYDVSDWAVEGVNAMSGLGIVKGDGVSITPKSNTSVEQAIAMTYRLYNKIK